MSEWRLTLFRDDDETPLAGTMSGEAVAEASCSTDPSHPRPYLMVPETLAESEVDLAEGSSVIGQVNVRVLDRRRDPADQATGWLTALLAVPAGEHGAGESALNGRRALLEQSDDGASWFVLMDGIVGGVQLDESLVAYTLELRDIRERERKVRIFPYADTATVLPRGVLGGYGSYGTGWGARWLVPPTQPMVGEYRSDGPTQGRVDVYGMWRKKRVPLNLVVTPQVLETLKPESKRVGKRRLFLSGRIYRYENVYARVRLLWRYPGGAWTEIRAPVAYQWGSQGLIRTRNGQLDTSDDDRPVVTGVREVVLAAPSSTLLPANRRRVEVIVAYNGPPTEQYPLHLDGMTAGELLKKLYDGEYSAEEDDPITTLRIRYDEAAVLSLRTPVRARITEPVDDLREWVQEHLYKPLGAAPALDPRGRISPIRYALPPADLALTQLDDGNTAAGAGWEHSAGDVVNHVVVRYKRDSRVPLEEDPRGERSAGDGLAEVETTIERINAPSLDALGDKPLELEMSLFRAVGGVEGDPIQGSVESETAFNLAMERADQALDRFVYGAQRVSARCRRAATAHLRVGDWVLVSLSWLPDYRTGVRGGTRLAQVVALKDLDPAWRELTLLDAGPGNQLHSVRPTLGTPTPSEEVDGVVLVPVTGIPAGAEARVEYAVADALPAADAGSWLPLERASVPGTVLETPPLPAGARVWVRARSESPGVRPSAYTVPVSVELPQAARLGEVRLDVDPATGDAVVTWIPNAFARGVRLFWGQHHPAAEPVLSARADVDAAAAAATLPVPALFGRTLTVEVEPWTGWTGTAVSGTPGPRQRVSWHLRAADSGKVRVAVEVADDGSTGTLTLGLADPEELVTGVAFWVTDGAGSRTGPHPADRTPASGVHQKDVALHPEHNVVVEPVVALYDGSEIRPGGETFDRDRSANLVGRPQVSYDGQNATVAATADSDTVSLHAQEWNGSAWLAPAELASGDRFAADRRGSFTVAARTTGKRRLRVFGRNAAGQAGPAEEVEIDRYQIRSPVAAKFWATVDPLTNLADLHLRVDGPQAVFPVTAEVFAQDPAGAPLPLGGTGRHVFGAPGQEVGPASYPALAGIELPRTGSARWWVKLSDAQGNPAGWVFASADRDRLPGGEVTPDDYKSTPSLVCTYDDDVEEVVVVVPGGRRKTFSGLSGGGAVAYTVSATPLDDGTREAPFRVGEGAGRGAYRVEYRGGGRTEVLFSGPLHGVGAQPPVCEPTVAMDMALRDRADVSVRVSSPVGERVGVEMKDSDAPGAPVWRWVAAPGSQAPAYAASGSTVGPGAAFAAEGLPGAHKLNDLLLARDQVRKLYVRAVGEDSGVAGAWTPVVLEARQQPWLASVDLTFDEGTDELAFTVVGGAFCQSAELAVSDDPGFGANVRAVSAPLADGGVYTHRFALAAGERNRPWYGRGIPFNGPGAAGLSGEPAQDSAFVAASDQGVLPPAVTLAVRYTLVAATVTVTAAPGTGGRGPLQWRHRTDDDYEGGGAWGPGVGEGWAAFTSPRSVAVPRGNEGGKRFVGQVRDADGRVGEGSLLILPFFPGLGPGGRVNPRMPYADLVHTPYDALEGRWMVDTFYYEDAVLRPDVAIHDTGYGHRGITDVARRAIGGLTTYDPETGAGGEIARNAPLARIAPALPDISAADGRVATIAGTAVATVRDEARVGHQGVGLDPLNLIVNGGGQDGTAGWIKGVGGTLTSATDAARFGDRSLKLDHPTLADSWWYQDVPCTTGEVYEVSGWIKTTALPAADPGQGAFLNVNTVVDGVHAELTGALIERQGTAGLYGLADVGLPADGVARDWTFVRTLFRADFTGMIRLLLHLGYGGPQTGTAWFDGVRIERRTAYEVEGRRRVDTVYDADGRLASAVTVNDAGYAPRGLLDVVRRAIGGLTAHDPAANSGGEIARNAPLARIASVLPDVSGSDGRVVALGGRGALMVSRAQHGVFLETFENGASDVAGWILRWGTRPGTAVAEGRAGGKALRASGFTWMAFPQNIPFDPSKLYRIRARVRQVTDPTSGGKSIYVGVEGVAADGVTLVNVEGVNTWGSQHYVAASAKSFAAGAGWAEFTGFFKGWGTPVEGAASAASPSPLHPNVRYFRPLFVLNYSAGNGTAEIDYIAVDVLDEDLAERGYRTIKPGGAAILKGVTADDPGGVARDLGDAGRRAIGGLDASSYSVSQNVPLARLAPALPDINATDGRVATIAGTAVATVRDQAVSGNEGRRRVDTLYNADGRLASAVTVNDAGYAPRGLLDVVRRAIGGLTAYDPAANSGGEIARNAPLARIAPALPDLNASTGRIATVGGVRAEQVPSGLSGAQLCRNPDFLNGLDGYYVYNNAGGTHVQFFHETDAAAPNTSGRRIKVNVSGTTTSPGRGGFTLYLLPTDGPVQPGYYRRGAEIVFTIRAWIPAGATINFTTNAIGNEATWTWLTLQAGASAWTTYVCRVRIGTTGSFGSTGYFFLENAASTFDWYVAMVDAIDVTAPPTVFAGASLRSATGVRLADTDIVTSQGTSADTSAVGGRAATTVRDEASEGNRKAAFMMPYGDGNLREGLRMYDPGLAWRDLTDVSRRTQVGLTWADTAGNGAEIAKNAPLARIAAALPDINASDGRVATIAGTAAATVRDQAAEGNRKGTFIMPHGDGYLREDLQIHDPYVAWRNLTDVGRRAQVGLAWADAAGNGAEIAKNAPLARIAPVLPAIDPGTGKVNRSVAASDGSTLESTAGSADQANRLRSLVNNPSVSGTLERWTNPGGLVIVTGNGAPFTPGAHFWVHRLDSAGPGDDKITYSDWFEVEPSKAYEVTWYQAGSALSGSDYFGVHTRNHAWQDPGITDIDINSGGVHAWTNTNPYWWWGQNAGDRYYKHTGYILPVGAPLEWAVGLGENVWRVFRFNPTTKWLQLRYLNFYNSQAKSLYTGHIRVVETTPEAIEATRRAFGALDAKRRLTDQRRLNVVVSATQGSLQSRVPIYSYWDASAGMHLIEVHAHSVKYGFGTVSYNYATFYGSSYTTYYLWYHDPDLQGGSHAVRASTNQLDVIGDGNYYLGMITTGANGYTSGGGSGGGGGGRFELETDYR